MRVVVLFNDDEGLEHGEPLDSLAVRAVLDEVDAVEAACSENGWEPVRVAVDGSFDPFAVRADVVFNLVEGRNEPVVAHLLEVAGRPFTGSDARALLVAQQKPLARAALAAVGVPIPPGCVLTTIGEPIDGVRYPAIVKPSQEDASHGIAVESVVDDERAARERARYVIERYRQPALLEEFVAGREFGVSPARGRHRDRGAAARGDRIQGRHPTAHV